MVVAVWVKQLGQVWVFDLEVGELLPCVKRSCFVIFFKLTVRTRSLLNPTVVV